MVRPPRHGGAIAIVLGALMLSAVVLSHIALWLSMIPAALLALAVTGVWVWSVSSSVPAPATPTARSAWRLSIVLGVLMGLLVAAAFAGFGALYGFAPRRPSWSHREPLVVQGCTVYLTPGQMAAFEALKIAMIAALAAAVLSVLLSYRLNRGSRQ